jgi:hypothetical protein
MSPAEVDELDDLVYDALVRGLQAAATPARTARLPLGGMVS